MSKLAKVSISLVTQNGEKYLPFCLQSLLSQSCQDYSLLLIDNGSTDNTLSLVSATFPQINRLAHLKNLGFARAHNQAIAWSKSEYVMLLNQDVILDQDYLAKALAYLDQHSEIGAVSGKVLIWDFVNNQKTKQIDSLGLKVLKNHRVVEIGQGEQDNGQFEEIKEVFGVSGAVPIFRRQALEKIKIKGPGDLSSAEYLDEDFFAYKEDVDLAWRLRLAGCRAVYLPACLAYHDRSVKGSSDLSDRAAKQARKNKDKMVRIYSYKNHLLTLLKNEFFSNWLRFFWLITWYELKKFLYIVFCEKSSWPAFRMFLLQAKKILRKRKYIIQHIRTIDAKELAGWYQ